MMNRIFLSMCILILCSLWAAGPAAATATSAYPSIPSPEAAAAGDVPTGDTQPTTEEETFRKLFRQGYDHYIKGKYSEAAAVLYQFLSRRNPDETDYEWAEFFFGISLHKLGYTHAAVDTLSNLVTRKPNPQIVCFVLELFEQITRTGPFDRDMLIQRSLCDQSYGFVDGRLADFVHYYQGEYDWEHGLFDWGDEHFAQIRPETFYYYKYLFKRSLRAVYANRIDEAATILKQVIAKLPDGDPLKDDARKTLARLYYEKGKFSEADFLYQQIEMNIVEQAQNLMERAWAHYRMGNPERSMGLLYSFEAPSYANSFTPEFFILKSFIYKDVCHYRTAMRVLEQFKERYGEALENIYHRRPLQDNRAMLLVILAKPRVKREWQFLNLLEREHERATACDEEALRSYLDDLYTLKRNHVERTFRLLVTDEYEKMADAMLRFEEEAHLMEYEIGIDMYQRVNDIHYSDGGPNAEVDSDDGGKAVYAFQGEFWNDELDDYEVELPNKCQNAEEWDIFFK